MASMAPGLLLNPAIFSLRAESAAAVLLREVGTSACLLARFVQLPTARPCMGLVLYLVQKAVDVDGGAGAPPLHHYSSGGSREEGGSSKLKQEGKKGFHGQWRGGRGKGPLMC